MDYISERRMLVISVIETENPNAVPIGTKFGFNLFGDPYGTRTHVTTVKGWCLNRLTNGPFIFNEISVLFVMVAAMRFELMTFRV